MNSSGHRAKFRGGRFGGILVKVAISMWISGRTSNFKILGSGFYSRLRRVIFSSMRTMIRYRFCRHLNERMSSQNSRTPTTFKFVKLKVYRYRAKLYLKPYETPNYGFTLPTSKLWENL